jgi:dihydrofolate synthase/folylpolyglutamate synthase
LAGRPDFESASPDQQRATSFPLGRPAALLERLGRPDRRCRIVLIAGTKGKGSTAVLTAAILQAHGSRVGLYTQPHLHTFRERLRIDGVLISKAEFAAAVELIIPVVAELDAAQP